MSRWSPFFRTKLCECRRRFSYPNYVVKAIVNKREQLSKANRVAQAEIQRLTAMVETQAARIHELEENVQEEQGRANALHGQFQAINGQLTRVVQEVKDRTEGIITECGTLIEQVISVEHP